MTFDPDPTPVVRVAKPVDPASGPPLLFVHGMCHAAWCWEEHFLPWFARRGYPAFALSLRGHGGSVSRKPLRSLTLADYVADVTRVVDTMPAPPVLIGHSMGGLVVQIYLEMRRHPAALLLASVPPHGMLPATLRFARRHFRTFLHVNRTRSLYPLVATPERCRALLFSPDLPDNRLARYHALMTDESYRAYWDGLGLHLPRPRRIDTPIGVMGAGDDALVTVRENQRTAQVYGSEAIIVPEMAHDMMLDSGWERVADEILHWLRASGLGPAGEGEREDMWV